MFRNRQGHLGLVRGFMLAATVACVSALVTRQVISQEKTNGDQAGGEAGKPAMSEKDKAMMEEWMKSAAPGPNHEHLKPLAGEWNISGKFWMDPNSPPQESKSTATTEWILGGRFLLQKVKGEAFEGMPPFEGLGITGYNNTIGKYESVWVDNMSTLMMTSQGSCNGRGNRFNYAGDYTCPMTKVQKKFRTEQELVDNDHMRMDMYDQTSDGKEFKSMELHYHRAKPTVSPAAG